VGPGTRSATSTATTSALRPGTGSASSWTLTIAGTTWWTAPSWAMTTRMSTARRSASDWRAGTERQHRRQRLLRHLLPALRGVQHPDQRPGRHQCRFRDVRSLGLRHPVVGRGRRRLWLCLLVPSNVQFGGTGNGGVLGQLGLGHISALPRGYLRRQNALANRRPTDDQSARCPCRCRRREQSRPAVQFLITILW
jgi:hypothetical protein